MNVQPVVIGLVFSLFAYILFSGFDTAVKFLSKDFTVFQVMAVSYAFASFSAFLFALWQRKAEQKPLALRRPVTHILRGVAQAGSSLLFFAGFTSMPLTDFYIFVFLIPIFVALLSAAFLKERMTIALILSVVVSFAGVLVAFGPRGSFGLPYMLVLAGAVVNAVGVLFLRQLAKTEPEGVVALSVNMFLALGGLFMALPDWRPMTETFLMVCGGAGLMYGAAMILVTYAFRLAPAGIASVPQFLQLVWGAILGALLFNEIPPLSVYIGGSIVILANVFLMMWQNRKSA